MREVGYAADVDERTKQHRNHTSSNYLMNLLNAICQTFPTDIGGCFVLKVETIHMA